MIIRFWGWIKGPTSSCSREYDTWGCVVAAVITGCYQLGCIWWGGRSCIINSDGWWRCETSSRIRWWLLLITRSPITLVLLLILVVIGRCPLPYIEFITFRKKRFNIKWWLWWVWQVGCCSNRGGSGIIIPCTKVCCVIRWCCWQESDWWTWATITSCYAEWALPNKSCN